MPRILIALLLAVAPLTAAAEESFTEEELLEFVQEYAPSRYERLISLKETDPDRYEQALQKVSEKVIERKLKRTEYTEQTAEMKARFMELAAQHEAASKRQQPEIRAEMEAMADEFFSMQLEVKRMRLEAIQARVDRMEAQLLKHEESREEIIDSYITKALDAVEEGE